MDFGDEEGEGDKEEFQVRAGYFFTCFLLEKKLHLIIPSHEWGSLGKNTPPGWRTSPLKVNCQHMWVPMFSWIDWNSVDNLTCLRTQHS